MRSGYRNPKQHNEIVDLDFSAPPMRANARADGRSRSLQQQDPGDASGEAIPVPIPNTEVKLSSAEDTERAAFRENRSSPGSCAFRWLFQSIDEVDHRIERRYAAPVTLPGPDQRLSPRPADDEAAAPAGPRGCPFLLADGGGW